MTNNTFFAKLNRVIDFSGAWKAALFLGLIVWAINAYQHSALDALPAGIKQACYTFFVAGFILKLCENISVKSWRFLPKIILATLLPSSIAVGLTFFVHSLKGTPEPFYSTLPTLIMAPPAFLIWGIKAHNQSLDSGANNA